MIKTQVWYGALIGVFASPGICFGWHTCKFISIHMKTNENDEQVCYLCTPYCQRTKSMVIKSLESAKMCDITKVKHSSEKRCPFLWNSLHITIWKGKTIHFWLSKCYLLTPYELKLSIIMFCERYLLTLFGLSGSVFLTLFCWLGNSFHGLLESIIRLWFFVGKWWIFCAKIWKVLKIRPPFSFRA